MTPVPSNQSGTKARALQLNLIHGHRVTSVHVASNATQAEKLRDMLAEQGFEFHLSRPYLLFSAGKANSRLRSTKRVPKVVIHRGKDTQDFRYSSSSNRRSPEKPA